MTKGTVKPLSDVTATRDGRKQTFTRQTWDLLGPVHQGWEELKETPKELEEPKDVKKSGASVDANTPAKPLTVAQQKKADAEAWTAKSKDADEESSASTDDVLAQLNKDQEGGKADDGEK